MCYTEDMTEPNDIVTMTKRADILYAGDAAAYLGIEVQRPENAMGELITKKLLKERKMRGRLYFLQAELDVLIDTGDTKKSAGRPVGAKNKHSEAA